MSLRSSLIRFLALMAGLLALVEFLTRARLSYHEVNSLASVCYLTLSQCWLPVAWMAAAAGFGVWLAQVFLRSPQQSAGPWGWTMSVGLGTAALLWLDRLCGALGWLQAGNGAGAWAVLAVGWVLLAGWLILRAWQGKKEDLHQDRFGSLASAGLLLPAVPALAVLVVACCSIPGWLWDSEFAGYDVLEYHMQLPAEWLAAGRITPPAYNVYGHLPSFVESAYYHLSVLYSTLPTFVVEPERSGVPLNAAVHAAIACQMLHGLMTLAAAGAIARFVRVSLMGSSETRHLDMHTVRVITGCAFAIMISVPWTVIVGSMAYDEMPVVLFFALGLSIIVSEECREPSEYFRVGAILGILVGSACGAKLTSIGLVDLPLFVAFIVVQSGRQAEQGRSGSRVIRVVLWAAGGTAAGLAVLLPWLVQNAIETGGNPVFPFATSLFGSGDWTAAQVQRWDNAHMVVMPTAERLQRVYQELVIHAQYAGLWILGLIGIALMWLPIGRLRIGRRVCVIVTVALAVQTLFWVMATHLESRFLIPALVPLTAAIPLVVARFAMGNRIRVAVCAVVPLALGVWTVIVFLGQQEGRPASLIDGIGLRTGSAWQALPIEKQRELATVYYEGFLNLGLHSTDTVYLIGDATPFYITSPKVIWNTTWDQSLLGSAIEAAPDDPSQWAAYLSAHGVDYLVVNYVELYRLTVVDKWYDDRVTIEDVRLLVQDHGVAVMSWPDEEPVRFLYRLVASK